MDSRRRGHHNRRRPTPPFQIDRDGRYEISAAPPRFFDNHRHHRSSDSASASASASASSPYPYSYSSQLPSSPLPPPPPHPSMSIMEQKGNYMFLPSHHHSRFYMEGMDQGSMPRLLVEHPPRVSDHRNMGRFIYDSPSHNSSRGSDRVVFPHSHPDSRRSGYFVDDEFIVDDGRYLRFMVPPPPPPPPPLPPPPPPPPPYSGVSHTHSDGRGQGIPYRWTDKEEMMTETIPHHHHQHQRMLLDDAPPVVRRKRRTRENEGNAEFDGEHGGPLIVQSYDGRTMRKPGFRASNNYGSSTRARDNKPIEREPSLNLLLTDSRHSDGGDMVFPFDGRHKKAPRLVEDSSYGHREKRFAGKGKSMFFDAESSQDVGCSGSTRIPKPSVMSRIQYPKSDSNRLEEHKPTFSHSDELNNSANPDVGYKSNALTNKKVLTSSPTLTSTSVVEFRMEGRSSIGRKSPEQEMQREWPLRPDHDNLVSSVVVTNAVDSKNKSNTIRTPVLDKKSEGRVISLHSIKKTVLSGSSGSLKGSDLKSVDDSGFLNGNSRINTPVGISSEEMVKTIMDSPRIITKKSVEEARKQTTKDITQSEHPSEKVTMNFSVSHMKKKEIEETNLRDCEDVGAPKMLHATETLELLKEQSSKRSSVSDVKCYLNSRQKNPMLKNKPNKEAEIHETIILDHSDSEIEKDKTFKEPILQERTFTQFATASENVTSESPDKIEGLSVTPVPVSSNLRTIAVGAPLKKEAEENTLPSTSFTIVGQNCNDSVIKKNNGSPSTWTNSNENVDCSAVPLRNQKRKNKENTSNLDVSTNLGFSYESKKLATPFFLPKDSVTSKEHDVVSKKKWKRRRTKSHCPIVDSSIIQSPKKTIEEISAKVVFACPNVEDVGCCRSSEFSGRTGNKTIAHAVKIDTMNNDFQGRCVSLTEDISGNSLGRRDLDAVLPSTDSTALEDCRLSDTGEINIENSKREDMKKVDTKMQCSILNDNSSLITESDHHGENLEVVDSKEDPKKSCLTSPLKRSFSEPQLLMELDKANLGTHLIHEAKLHQVPQEARKLIGNKSKGAEREVSIQVRDHQKGIQSQLLPGIRFPLKAGSNQNVRNRTWRREDICAPPQSTRHLSQRVSSSGSLQKAHDGSYVRKGNSLIRKSSTTAPSRQCLDVGAADRIDASSTSEGKIDHTDAMFSFKIGGTSSCSENPKSPPISFSSNTLTSCTSDPLIIDNLHLNENKVEASLDGGVAVLSKNRNLDSSSTEHPNFLKIEKSKVNYSKPMVYVKHKSNQLVAASGVKDGKSSALHDNYHFARNKNQLSCDNPLANAHIKQVTAIENFKNDNQKSFTMVPQKENIGCLYQREHGKDFTAKKKLKEPRSMVWRLGVKSQHEKACFVRNILPHIFPWKRPDSWKLSMNNTSRKLSTRTISKKLQISRKRDTIYTISKGGFSLKKSGVRSIGGSNLKWSKSIERHSKKANEEATLAVAEAERKKREQKVPLCHTAEIMDSCVPRERVFRIGTVRYKMDSSRRTLVRLSDSLSSSAPNKKKLGQKTQLPFIPKRLLIGTDEYIRIGNGNQLIRDPKRHVRNLATDKIRWSLHTARLRLAKKRQYCQFFTRYGKCNKYDGKCPYIHDTKKVAICTKFLKGPCSGVDCRLTHEVIPERMPDCSYFLRGLCSNASCPYRHVKVKSTSSVCEGFLKGYCPDGDECRKKHSYICPDFEATGKCIDGSSCKLHHPKPRNKSRKQSRSNTTNTRRNRNSGKRRYFISNTIVESDSRMLDTTEGKVEKKEGLFCDGAEYISLGFDNEDLNNRVITNTHFSSSKCNNGVGVGVDHLIKPLLIMNHD